jgi:hypothetical protein
MEKTYWGVASEFDAKGGLIGAHIHLRSGAVKPHDNKRSRLYGIYFEDWFETREEAVSYLNDVRGERNGQKKAGGGE